MLCSRKMIAIAVSGLVVLIAAFVIARFYTDNEPAILEEMVGDSIIYIEASRYALLFPGECVSVKWEIENIRAVYIRKANKTFGTTGLNSTIYCIWAENPTLQIDFPDGSSESYTVEIEHLYTSAPILLLFLLVITAACILSYFLLGMPGVLFILTIATFASIFNINVAVEGDFQLHLHWLEIAKESGNLQDLPPHFVFHYMTLILTNIFPSITLIRASFLVVLFSQIGTVVGFYYLFLVLDQGTKQDKRLKIVYGIFALALVWVGPISYFTSGFSLSRTAAYLYANTYHSPTMIVMRVFGVWLFVVLMNIPPKWSKGLIGYLIAIVLLLLLGSFSKPNYTLVIVPAYLVMMAIQFLRNRQISKTTLLVAVTLVITATLALGWQYFAAYSSDSTNIIAQQDSSIQIEWFGLYRRWGIAPQSAITHWFASLIFPISVYLLYIKKSWQEDSLNLSWISLLGAIAMAVLFIEVPRTVHGNFVWGTRITTLITFSVSISFLVRQRESWTATKIDWRFWVCLILFITHVLSFVISTFIFYS